MTAAFLLFSSLSFNAAPPVRGEEVALAYLAREVPRWYRANRCYSCHHNGDAARALYSASMRGHALPASLADTTRWLAKPDTWDKNGGQGPFSDKKLARIQFAATLSVAYQARALTQKPPLQAAAALVAVLQEKDGSWQVVPRETLGSPTTLGNALATHLAVTTLRHADPSRYRDAIAQADAWLRKAPLDSNLDAAAMLLALAPATDRLATAQKQRSLDRIRQGGSRSGGWGPYAGSSPEVFDTAVVVLALAALPPSPERQRQLRAGRGFLLSTQEADGCWPETTRPSGADSLSQRLSTAGWATLALLATDPLSSPRKAP